MPLALACTNGSLAMVERLLGAGADANAADEHGATALMFAARTGKLDVIDALLGAGAEVGVHDAAHGQTALMWAAAAGHAPAQRQLIEAGADVQARSAGGYTPLLFAVRENHEQSVRLLLDRQADANAAAVDGTTALVVAVVHGNWPLAHLLLDHGADPDADGAGFAALHWAAGVWETALTTTESGRNDRLGPLREPRGGEAGAGARAPGGRRGPQHTAAEEPADPRLSRISPHGHGGRHAVHRGGARGGSRHHARPAGGRARIRCWQPTTRRRH